MAISELERARIKHHLRFPGVQYVTGFVEGAPTTVEALYPIDGSISNLTLEGEQIVRDQLSECDAAEKAIGQVKCHASVSRVGNTTLNPAEFATKKEYYKWACKRLADTLGCDLNPWGASNTGRNIPREMS